MATRAVERALLQGQMFWKKDEDEPPIDSDRYVRIRELAHAADLLAARVPEHANEPDPEAWLSVWNAIKSGEIVCRALPSNEIIPPVSWPHEPDGDRERGFYDSVLFHGQIPDWSLEIFGELGGLRAFVGQVPVIRREEALLWLSGQTPARRTGGRPRKSEDVARIYLQLFPDGHRVEGLSREDAAERVSAGFGERTVWKTIENGLKEVLLEEAERKKT